MTLMPGLKHEHVFVCSNLTESRCFVCHRTPKEIADDAKPVYPDPDIEYTLGG